MNKKDKADFFRLYSVKIGTGDVELAKRSYYALVKTMMSLLRTQEFVELPDLGKMFIKHVPAHKRHNVSMGVMVENSGFKEIKFCPCRNLSYYIRSIKTIHDTLKESS